MATSLKKFKASELAAVLGWKLRRGRPSAELRGDLEYEVRRSIDKGYVGVRKGQLTNI